MTLKVDGLYLASVTPASADTIPTSRDRLQEAALVVLALLPVAMVVANRSAPVWLAVGALLSLAGRLRAGEGWMVYEGLRRQLASPPFRAALAFLVLAGASAVWSPAPDLSLRSFGELVFGAGVAWALHLSLPRHLPKAVVLLAAAGVALACALVMGEFATGLALHRWLGARSLSYVLNRPAVTLALVAWPVVLLLWHSRRCILAVGLVLLVGVTLARAASSTAVLAAGAGTLTLGIAFFSRRVALACVGVGLLAALALAPVLGDLAETLLPAFALEALDGAHARERIGIWRMFGALVHAHPLLGAGLGTGPVADVPVDARTLLGAWHAHNGYLQIWTELGLAGALLAALAIVLAWRALLRLGPALSLSAFALAGAGASVMLVGHGAWQAWWWASLGAACVWSARSPEPD